MKATASMAVAALAMAPLALGAIPASRTAAVLVGIVALIGVASVWRVPSVALLIAATGLTLAVADLAIRPFGDAVFSRPEVRHARPWRVDPLGVRYDADLDETWDIVGDLASSGVREPRRVEFVTDARGFRNGASSRAAHVVLLGDSFGAGAGTTQQETLARHLDALGHPTVDLSVAGASPYDEAVTLEAELPRLSLAPDAVLVWLLFAGNDLEGECRSQIPGAPSAWNRLRAVVARVRARSVIGLLLRDLGTAPPPTVIGQLPDGSRLAFHARYLESARLTEPEARPSTDCLEGVVLMVDSLAQSAGLDVLVAVGPTKAEVYGPMAGLGAMPSGPRTVLRSVASQRFSVLDVTPALETAAHDGRRVWWRDDTHWNGQGHRVVASAIAAALEAGADSSSRAGTP